MSEISSPYGHAWHADVCDYRRGAGGVAAAQVSRIAPSLPPSLASLARLARSSVSLSPPLGESLFNLLEVFLQERNSRTALRLKLEG